jgi:hypothetical protein
MKLFNAFGEPGMHTTVATSFGVDFMAYEQLVLARLREAGCMNNIVLADARMLTYALDDAQRPPLLAGRSYSLVGAEAPGLFHPKLTLQLGTDCARLLVASANLTASGLAGNLEVVGEVRMEPGDDEHAPLMRDALDFIDRFIPPAEQGARKQLEWARSRSPWLQQAGAAGSAAAARLLVSGSPTGIGPRFIDLVGGEATARLIAISPYWDEGMAALRFLQGALRPRHTALVIQPDRGLFPASARVKADIYEVGPLVMPRDRFAHAKVLIVQTRKADHVLFGSPNCTVAALGSASQPGDNVEAALYRRMDSGAAIEALGLAQVLDGRALAADDFLPYTRAAEIPLEQVGARQPGRFQLRGRQLTWTPAPAFDVPGASVELLDSDQELVLTVPPAEGRATAPPAPAARVFQLAIDEAPSFARVRDGGRVSAISVVHVEEMILANLRPPKSRRIQEGLDILEGSEDEGLIVYEALELIVNEELRLSTGPARAGAARRGQRPGAEGRVLTYEEFIRARAPGLVPDMARGNTLASSHANEVRSFLNALIGVEDGQLADASHDQTVLAMPLGLGDETADGEQALEEGGDLDAATQPTVADAAATPPAVRERDTEEAIVEAVRRFNERLAAAAEQRGLNTRDLLRVRVLLTVLLASGSTQLYRRAPSQPGERRPVLLAKGDRGWPRLVGQVLYRLFGAQGNGRPLIQQVVLQQLDDGADVPIDVLECLATCFWAVGALAFARDEKGAPCELASRAHQRAEEMYGMAILETADLVGDHVEKVMHALGARYGVRLGLDAEQLMTSHAGLAASVPVLKLRWLAAPSEAEAEVGLE